MSGHEQKPMVSVLIPVRDGAAELSATQASLDAQSYRDFEIVVVDDGSRDATPTILARWAADNAAVRCFTVERRGIVAALELGLSKARAPLIARMDADDIAHSQRLSKQVEAFAADPRLDVLGTGFRLFPRNDALGQGMRKYESWLNSLRTHDDVMRNLFVESPLCHPTVMVRSEALRQVGGYRSFDGPEDYDLWLRLARAGMRFAVLPEKLLSWRHSPGRATLTDSRYREEAFFQLKLHHLLAWHLTDVATVSIWGAGQLGKRWARHLRAAGCQIESFIDVDPRKVGQTIHGASVVGLDAIPPPKDDSPILVAVGVERARRQIRQTLLEGGHRELESFICVQ